MFENLSRSWRRGFEVARAASEHSNGHRPGEKMGAALYSGATLVSIGYNWYGKTHPASYNLCKNIQHLGERYNANTHAELHALLKRKHHNDDRQTIYVYRSRVVNHQIMLASSKPCTNCQRLLRLAGVRTARYFTEAGQAEEMRIS